MNLETTNRNRIWMIFSIFLVIALLGGIYLLYLNPKITENTTYKNSLVSEKKLVSILEEKIKNQDLLTNDSTSNLQKSIPVKPLTEQLLIDMEKAELISESTINSMVFSNSDTEQNSETGILEEKFEESTSLNLDDDSSTEEAEESTGTIEMPTGMKELTVNIEVQAKDYFSLEKFIETIENNERIVVVKTINFAGEEEKAEVSDVDELLTFHLAFSVFYMPNLIDLQESLPKLEIPEPGNKVNPFTN